MSEAIAVWATLILIAGVCFWRSWRNSDVNRMADPTPAEAERIREALERHLLDLMALADATRERYCPHPDGELCACRRRVRAMCDAAESEANR